MRLKILFFLAFTILVRLSVTAQIATGVIRGRVLDSQTLEPLPFASVYINFTTIGTSADANGEFVLMGIPAGDHDLVVSHIGHQSYQTKVTVVGGTESTLIVKLIISVLKNVEIKSKKDALWETQLVKFKKLFFGDSPHTALCKIYNPWSLEFSEDDKGNFIASATSPLEIENLSLGYRITYQLKKFSVGPVNYSITGNVRFQNILTLDSTTTAIWARRRANVYEGSYRHLFKAMVDGRSTEAGFELYDDRSGDAEVVRSAHFLTNVNKSLFVFSTEGKVVNGKLTGQYILQLPPRLEVHYLNRSATTKIYTNVANPVSWIEVSGGYLEVNQQGVILNPLRMTVLGAMGESRIAEILPYDFQPMRLNSSQPQQVKRKQVSAIAHLLEKPYLHTDRSYYYPHEVIWFEGYMNYLAPVMKDSLSKVLYVDIVNASKQIIATRLFPIVDGRITGSFPLLPKWGKGDYTLRAYTRWMLNFDDSFVFTRPFKIIDYSEKIKQTEAYNTPTYKQSVEILSDANQFKPREKVTLSVDTKDFYGYSKGSHLSVSVTDLNNAVPASNDKHILSSFLFSLASLPDSLPRNTPFLIQNGIEMKGRFVTTKKKLLKGLLTFYQDNSDDLFNILTEDNGNFFMPNLYIYDTARLYVSSKSVKGNKAGRIILDTVNISPVAGPLAPLNLEIDKSKFDLKDPRTSMPDELPMHLLENVTITSTHTQNFRSGRSAAVIHNGADFTIEEDWIRKAADSGDFLSLLQTKIPGLKVVTVFAEGFPIKYIVLGGPASSIQAGVNPEPLVLVDGNALNGQGTAADQLAAMGPSTIQRIEVIKYGGGAAYGMRGGNGVIAVYTVNSKEDAHLVPKLDKTKLQEVETKGYSNVMKFISPDHSRISETNTKGDFRITLYWNPEVITDGKKPTEISFFAADLPTQYRVVVEGVNDDGKPVRGEKLITIKE